MFNLNDPAHPVIELASAGSDDQTRIPYVWVQTSKVKTTEVHTKVVALDFQKFP